ncbi:electron transfer flavoprotein subunit alpha/FixB family protein [Clostridium algidicarnis]|uniref:electron transfer flavoprotein subunit alpha/FixB family protein n=1 Tax=Clostridium algidicarnis TaxID=37659 RepID=UPI001C0DDC2E|nr:electron transfer flavoprotein subunit alpha/FixB family protein [Clostridium algidicarnis]MBU3196535.1 electron transfer flavoprotein subunit alpha/FixB family protein [Clostridium algidicarnis]MBU3209887.1 electron transfer flavoprotein subunit alpha/FixB family protein [Clostridium algidicarnis]MBU3228425.1 electron transfer flavoprotein subunit alpha/FixB family protein [Clostridium algidicarnis]MBU3252169.1 electron transfer flavoprotein subunit alpha/FixB family protein [Clostridium al
MNIADYKGVWVFAEQRDGKLQKISLELIAKGREMADKLGVKLTSLLLGNDVDELSKTLIAYGADEVLQVESELLNDYTTDGYTKVVCELVDKYKPEVLFIGATFVGRDLGPRVAARLNTGLTADCTALDIDEETKHLLMTRPAFGGNLMATIECADHRPQMATIRPGVFAKLIKDESREKNIIKIEANLKQEDIRTKIIDIKKIHKEIEDITEAKVLVAGGRGVGDKESFNLLKELAETMGGTVAASRAAIEKNWLDKDYQVGQTGKTVRPNIYIACGISGAIQHLAGMQESDIIIAINKDESAPIMKLADYAIVGDFNKVIPEMISQFKTMQE